MLSTINTARLISQFGLYISEVLRGIDKELNHMTRAEEVQRQILKLCSNGFSAIHEHAGVLNNLMVTVVESGTSRVLVISCIVVSKIRELYNQPVPYRCHHPLQAKLRAVLESD